MNRWPFSIVFIALAVFLLAATCDNSHGGPPGDSGISGIVTIGPMCPVERVDTPCPDQPFQATIVVDDAHGKEVTRFDSGADGSFRVALAPGSYTLVPQSPNGGGPPSAGEQTVEVRSGAYTDVTIQYDSGIR